MSDQPSYVIFENTTYRWLSPALAPHLMAGVLTQPPTISSREELEAFIRDLREAGDRVFSP